MFRLKDKVQYIITDRPLILSLFYNYKYGDNSSDFKNIVLHEVNKFDNINIFLNRTKPYVEKGRNQTEEESNEFSEQIYNIVSSNTDINMITDCEQSFTSNKILNFLNER